MGRWMALMRALQLMAAMGSTIKTILAITMLMIEHCNGMMDADDGEHDQNDDGMRDADDGDHGESLAVR